MEAWWEWMAWPLLGMLIGTVGTLVGAGGGFLLVPVLLAVRGDASAAQITAVSMALIFCNAFSGTLAYARMKRVDFATGALFALAALPGALLGAASSDYIPRLWFERIFAVVLLAIALFLFFGRRPTPTSLAHEPLFAVGRRGRQVGALISAGVGYLSSVLGIGGGIVHVPALVYGLGYPVHRATATSHFVLACTSFIALAEHLRRGSYAGFGAIALSVAAGGLIGAQLGARLSARIRGATIIKGLALALALASLRIIGRSLA